MARSLGFMSDLFANVKPVEDTTVSKKVIVARQWNWQEFFHEVKENLKRNFSIFIPILTVFFIGVWMQSPVFLRSEATSSSATVSLLPEFDTLPKEKTFQVWIRSEKQVATVYLEILFDPKAIQISREITSIDPRYTKRLSVTTKAEANASGRIVLSYEIDPKEKSRTQLTSFKFADISFTPIAVLGGQTTPVTFGDESKIQAVDGSWFGLKRFGSTYLLVDDTAVQIDNTSHQP